MSFLSLCPVFCLLSFDRYSYWKAGFILYRYYVALPPQWWPSFSRTSRQFKPSTLVYATPSPAGAIVYHRVSAARGIPPLLMAPNVELNARWTHPRSGRIFFSFKFPLRHVYDVKMWRKTLGIKASMCFAFCAKFRFDFEAHFNNRVVVAWACLENMCACLISGPKTEPL